MADESITFDLTISTERFEHAVAAINSASLGNAGLFTPWATSMIRAAEQASAELAKSERDIAVGLAQVGMYRLTSLQWFDLFLPRLVTARRRRVATQMRRTQRRAARRC